MTEPRWTGDKCGLNLLIYISYSLLSQGASEEPERDSWKGPQSQFYLLVQNEIIPLSWSMAQAARWDSPSYLESRLLRLRSWKVGSLPELQPAYLDSIAMYVWSHLSLLKTVATLDHASCHIQANQASAKVVPCLAPSALTLPMVV